MRTWSKNLLTLLSSLVVAAFMHEMPCHGQELGGGARHVHDLHPTFWHGENVIHKWKRVYLGEMGWDQPEVTAESSEIDRVFGQGYTNSTCQDLEISISETRERTHSVALSFEEQVGINVNLEAAAALFLKLKATAHAQVTFNQELVDTNKEIITVNINFTLHPCQNMYYHVWKTKYNATGIVTGGSHKIICECVDGIHSKPIWCEEQTITGAGVGFDNEDRELVQRGLVDPCPCTNVVDGTELVFEPQGPPIPPGTPQSGGGG